MLDRLFSWQRFFTPTSLMAAIVGKTALSNISNGADVVVLKRRAEFLRRITPSSSTSTNVVLLVEDTCVILSREFSFFLAIINRPDVHPGMARSIRGHPGIGHCVSRYGILACDFRIIRLLRRSINFRPPTPRHSIDLCSPFAPLDRQRSGSCRKMAPILSSHLPASCLPASRHSP